MGSFMYPPQLNWGDGPLPVEINLQAGDFIAERYVLQIDVGQSDAQLILRGLVFQSGSSQDARQNRWDPTLGVQFLAEMIQQHPLLGNRFSVSFFGNELYLVALGHGPDYQLREAELNASKQLASWYSEPGVSGETVGDLVDFRLWVQAYSLNSPTYRNNQTLFQPNQGRALGPRLYQLWQADGRYRFDVQSLLAPYLKPVALNPTAGLYLDWVRQFFVSYGYQWTDSQGLQLSPQSSSTVLGLMAGRGGIDPDDLLEGTDPENLRWLQSAGERTWYQGQAHPGFYQLHNYVDGVGAQYRLRALPRKNGVDESAVLLEEHGFEPDDYWGLHIWRGFAVRFDIWAEQGYERAEIWVDGTSPGSLTVLPGLLSVVFKPRPEQLMVLAWRGETGVWESLALAGETETLEAQADLRVGSGHLLPGDWAACALLQPGQELWHMVRNDDWRPYSLEKIERTALPYGGEAVLTLIPRNV